MSLAIEALSDELDADFRRFYEEVDSARRQAGESDDPTAADAAARQLHHHLRNLIELQDMQARRGAGRSASGHAEQLRYLKAALADEILLNRPWAGRAVWPGHLLEAALFQTSVAGDRVLDAIERLLADREPAARPLARLYLFALALGFEGRLRGADGATATLRGLRGELYQFVYQREPGIGERGQLLAPQAYANTPSHLAPRRQRRVARWAVVWLIGLLGLLTVSELLWLWPTWPLRQAMNGSAQSLHPENPQ
ncbi:DotU family type IV/VI secretion system protein [Derxia lacustris]|uniref:DotU family type IV/VI secretion system protein n=1 Tax=Derxia lacustris TaxID=764842 RepID=UPI000A16D2E3|nr:DotU family type IV/VI secretion system protein [Derxia lacustris]